MEPGQEGLALAEGVARFVDLEEGLLGQFHGVVARAHQRTGDMEGPPAQVFHQLVEGLSVPALDREHQPRGLALHRGRAVLGRSGCIQRVFGSRRVFVHVAIALARRRRAPGGRRAWPLRGGPGVGELAPERRSWPRARAGRCSSAVERQANLGPRSIAVEGELRVELAAREQIDRGKVGCGEEVPAEPGFARARQAVDHDRGQPMVQEIDQHRARDREGGPRPRERRVQIAAIDAHEACPAGSAHQCLECRAQGRIFMRHGELQAARSSGERQGELEHPRQVAQDHARAAARQQDELARVVGRARGAGLGERVEQWMADEARTRSRVALNHDPLEGQDRECLIDGATVAVRAPGAQPQYCGVTKCTTGTRGTLREVGQRHVQRRRVDGREPSGARARTRAKRRSRDRR